LVALAFAVDVVSCTNGASSPDALEIDGVQEAANVPPTRNAAVWPMHQIDARYRGANSLQAADVDGDGHPDYVTNYEFDSRYILAFHPGPGGDPKAPWPTVALLEPPAGADGQKGINTEYATFGDLDGDGNVDVIAAQGISEIDFMMNGEPGVRVFWGPGPSLTHDASAWIDGGRIPGTIEAGHFLYAQAADVNQDGALDVLTGGRIDARTGKKTGVLWLEAPADPARRRDLAAWSVRTIDAEQFGVRNALAVDLDQDGDLDVVLANADFDTPEEEEALVWYENPGAATAALLEPWPKHELYRGSDFYGKPQVVAVDLDGDGLTDLLTETRDALLYFHERPGTPASWDRLTIPKAPETKWISRTLKVADLDGDGRLDLLGMLLHEDGDLPADKAAVFWMSYDGDAPGADNWRTHVIKWGSGRTMLVRTFGEKWDEAHVTDVDGDGDLDVVANCEEWWEGGWGLTAAGGQPRANVAVAWFENRLFEAPFRFGERDGSVAIEAEHLSDAQDNTWLVRNVTDGFAGEGYVQDHDALDKVARAPEASRGATYDVTLAGGTYAVWLRVLSPTKFGLSLGGALSDSAYLSMDDGTPFVVGDDAGTTDQWRWLRAESPLDLGAGSHRLTLRAREGGFCVDRLVFTRADAPAPTDEGPAETPL
jgi:hypothetical protein